MSVVEKRLAELDLTLPEPLELPSPNRTASLIVGNMLYLSGHGAALLEDETVVRRGRVGESVDQEAAYRTARALGLKIIATARAALGDLDRVEKVVKVLGMVNAAPSFEAHNKVVDGASDLFYEVFGPEVGCHCRSSVGVAGLVANQPVEIEAVMLVRN